MSCSHCSAWPAGPPGSMSAPPPPPPTVLPKGAVNNVRADTSRGASLTTSPPPPPPPQPPPQPPPTTPPTPTHPHPPRPPSLTTTLQRRSRRWMPTRRWASRTRCGWPLPSCTSGTATCPTRASSLKRRCRSVLAGGLLRAAGPPVGKQLLQLGAQSGTLTCLMLESHATH